ncbi:MAG TPA: chromosomal replication initiator protein DnaA [Candidatus Gemmiger excrementipullorum]|uniref:Chromosomal replication initiator protein DnaA n=1 Tax=Candidatus Gemmiger excrementipullorum TaxID=2838610 RepID=A0A9D1Y0P3_9FIRM|nr:chromosomal replication initiator protein DnaA [Candidatus Gemmiger excrementipullorum]
MDSINDVLEAAKEYCRDHTSDATFEYYIKPIKAVSFENSNTVTLEIRNAFTMGIVADRYTVLLKEAFKSVLGFDVEIAFVTPQPEEEKITGEQALKELRERQLPSGRYAFTFENFIKGPSNQFAYAAAQAVAANPSGAYNPLFIYGPSGLGKTHLLNAIQVEIKKNHPDYNIVYVDCEMFTNEIITAVKTATTEQFRQKYREADVLLIDDIQFLAGKESTQEEFFHTFNTLHNDGRQIVIASDRPAKEIKSLEERLRTRFEWGLTADIQPPDFETRVAIVKRKAELLSLKLPDDVAEYIANHLKQNIRQLEGAVKKLNAYYMLEGIAPCIGVTTTAIKDTLNDSQPIPVTIEKILNEVARTYNVMPADIRGKKRNANVSAARQMTMYIIREVTGMSMEAIGQEFQRDHSTVVYSIKTMAENIARDQHLKETCSDIIKNVRT